MEHPQTASHKITWEAEEFYYHPKNFSWYLLAFLASVSIAFIPWILSGRKDFVSPAIILIAMLGFSIYAGRKPKKKTFELSNSRIKVGGQGFDLMSFSRYWVETFPTHTQITLVGIKRTAMPIAFYLTDKELTKDVLLLLQQTLPESNPSKNPADWLTRKIKF